MPRGIHEFAKESLEVDIEVRKINRTRGSHSKIVNTQASKLGKRLELGQFRAGTLYPGHK